MNEPAFPTTCNVDGKLQSFNGLSRRDYFAACALQGILANANPEMCNGGADICAKTAVGCADALIEELAKDSNGKHD